MTILKSVMRPCPICDGYTGEVIHTQKFVLPSGHPLEAGYDVVCCPVCGFAYADTTANQRDYDAFYAGFSKYGDKATSTGGGGSTEDAARLWETAHHVANVLRNPGARVVDIGCAGGGLLGALGDLGYTNLYGLDPSPACVARANEIPGVHVALGSLSHIPLDHGTIDCVILSHVLEHVRDLREALGYVRQFLRPHASIYVETPDATRYADYVFAPLQDFNTEHINHFSPQCMENLLVMGGFRPANAGSKLLQSAPGMPYPALFMFGALAKEPVTLGALRKDEHLRGFLLRYIAKSRRIMEEINVLLQKVLIRVDEVVVWGTGQLAMKLLAETCLANVKIVAFVDGNPINQGRSLKGVPILPPDQLKSSGIPIIVTSILHYQVIADHIRALSLNNPIVSLRTA
jgi:SAM-dependent methyltransferase